MHADGCINEHATRSQLTLSYASHSSRRGSPQSASQDAQQYSMRRRTARMRGMMRGTWYYPDVVS